MPETDAGYPNPDFVRAELLARFGMATDQLRAWYALPLDELRKVYVAQTGATKGEANATPRFELCVRLFEAMATNLTPGTVVVAPSRVVP